MANRKIRVVVVDDAEFMRNALTKILESDPDIEVVGYGKTGTEAISAAKELRPDVITLDIDMPEMDGITALKHIMVNIPIPVVVVSALTHQGDVTFESLRLGVVDFLPKPSGSVSRDIELQKADLIGRIKIASAVDIEKIRRARIFPKNKGANYEYIPWVAEKILVVGTSLGGPNSIIRLICKLPQKFDIPIIITQDISPMILTSFVEKFNEMSRIRIKELKDGINLESSTAYVNSLSNDLTFQRRDSKEVVIAINPSVGNSIDTMMLSAADAFGSGTVGLLYAGVRQDGVRGFEKIRENRGTTILAGRKDYFLPDSNEEVLKRNLVDHILDESDIPSFIGGLF